jgi:hypothetical protein
MLGDELHHESAGRLRDSTGAITFRFSLSAVADLDSATTTTILSGVILWAGIHRQAFA